jgi:hypothetical protein
MELAPRMTKIATTFMPKSIRASFISTRQLPARFKVICNLNIGRKTHWFVKEDLSLTGMPKVFAFVTGKYKNDGIFLPASDRWHARFTPVDDNFEYYDLYNISSTYPTSA